MSDEILAKQKKAVKAFESEKRQALKKIKSTMGKGKKGKEALSAAEAEWKLKEEEMLARHKLEILSPSGGEEDASNENVGDREEPVARVEEPVEEPVEEEKVLSKKEKALQKKLAKRRAAQQKEKEREERIEQEKKGAGPSAKDIELQALKLPENHAIKEIPADGHCLYRAIASQTSSTYSEMRHLAAEELTNNREEYEPFFIAEDSTVSFEQHIQQVRDTAEWGGHIELRALAKALHKNIMVYSATAPSPLKIDCGDNSNDHNQILLTYHRHYYALGEHYNVLVPK